MSLQRVTRFSVREVRQSRRNFQRPFQVYRQPQVQEAVTSIEALMESGKIREIWDRISRWYQQVKFPQAPPSMEALDQVST